MIRSFCLGPRHVPPITASRIRRLQPLFHKLYEGVANDVDFLCTALAPSTSSSDSGSSSSGSTSCAWLEHELNIFRALAPWAASKPRLLLPNSVYLQPEANTGSEDAPEVVLSVGNVQAGEPYQLQLVHTLQRAEHGADVQSGPLHDVCIALAQAARLVHPSAPCVAILAKPLDQLALRTRCDVRGVGERLRTQHGIATVLYLSIDDLTDATVDASTRDLCLGPHRISTVYIRYDFSHPFGAHVPDVADGLLADNQRAAYLRREWLAVEAMERSRAVLSSSLGSRLAHRRRVQHALLAEPDALERFVSAPEAVELRRVLPRQWALGGAASHSHEAKEARDLFEAYPTGFVAKSALRPRTGSKATQDRTASGGVTLTAPDPIRALLASPAAEWFYFIRRWRRRRTTRKLCIRARCTTYTGTPRASSPPSVRT